MLTEKEFLDFVNNVESQDSTNGYKYILCAPYYEAFFNEYNDKGAFMMLKFLIGKDIRKYHYAYLCLRRYLLGLHFSNLDMKGDSGLISKILPIINGVIKMSDDELLQFIKDNADRERGKGVK